MCEPVTIATGVGLAASLAGAGLKAKADADEADFNAAQAEANARRADAAAQDALQRGEAEAGKLRMQAGQMEGKARVAIGTSGVQATSTSAVEALVGSTAMSELDRQTARANAAREAWGYRFEGQQQRNAAILTRKRKDAQTASTLLGMASSGAKGGLDVYSAWRKS